MPRVYRRYAVTLDQETRELLDQLIEQLSLPSRSAILRLAVRELAERHGLQASPATGQAEKE
jgi:metal-responsive CopG/Arc/MetJ family transcriptional regulator